MGEAEFRELMIELMTDDAMEWSTGREGKIVDLVAFLEALQEWSRAAGHRAIDPAHRQQLVRYEPDPP